MKNLPELTKAAIAAVVGLLLVTSGCGGTEEQKGETAEETTAPGGAVWTPTGDEGTLTGKVAFQGQAPKFRAIAMDADAVCAAKHSKPVYPEAVIVNSNGTLRNVFVYVKTGLEDKNFAVPDDPVELDQDGCIYKPHVLGIQSRQNLRVVSSDNTTHNIHPMPKVNREWNVSQPPGADPIIQVFNRPEATIPVKCNQHPWMRAYIHVISHPFYALSGEDGTFEIKGLPPGKYQLEAVHEEYGASTQEVTVAAKQSVPVEFKFQAAQTYTPSSLKVMPALVLSCCAGK
ncbi:MAG: carboxypeptidase regulatory-like domain-containing protein [Bryobacterales bacterium]|nr:carboxypeptidase regulatory-like domain-containing protein [Bryobacterales bacterium]